eukprot:scaffold79249_cov27-Cyclotella_meneghiniana.AAC.2
MVQRQYINYCVSHWHKHKLLHSPTPLRSTPQHLHTLLSPSLRTPSTFALSSSGLPVPSHSLFALPTPFALLSTLFAPPTPFALTPQPSTLAFTRFH